MKAILLITLTNLVLFVGVIALHQLEKTDRITTGTEIQSQVC